MAVDRFRFLEKQRNYIGKMGSDDMRMKDVEARKAYIQNVRKELTDGIGYWRCVCLVYLYMGGRNIGWVTKLWICKR